MPFSGRVPAALARRGVHYGWVVVATTFLTAVPINAVGDGWMGDDWFHGGAFRQDALKYAYDQEATRGSDVTWCSDYYDTWLATGSGGPAASFVDLPVVEGLSER